ncbi:MAG TPA: SGNH/GDSL hydrolase family protein [Candidatus Limnocylindria bacterium]|jgi:lysophospholipase L1-like esterase|nr:SGNH/GDSL hydrolase family protein [Candidatus Limnocylindria bacterium]
MKHTREAQFLFVAFLGLTGWDQAQPTFQLKDGDRVVFYGDSTTEIHFYDNIAEPRVYSTYVETYAVTRFPGWRLQFRNSAWGGDRAAGGRGGPIDVRLQRDVIAYKPTVMTLMLGMNDAWGLPYDAKLFNTFATGYEHIADFVKGAVPGIRLTVIQPSPYDDITRPPGFEGGYNGVLVRYGAFVKELGQRDGLTVADLNAPLIAALEKAKAADSAVAQKIIPDRVHPGPAGHLLMAEALLKAWNAPAIVAAVEIAAADKRVVRVENTSVTRLESTHGLSWTELDKALPFPIDMEDPAVVLAVRCSDLVQALNLQLLKVTGLTASRYVLKIDGEQIAVFGREELRESVNLALFNTPMKKQAITVHGLILKRIDVQFGSWRQVQVPLQDDSLPQKQAALEALDKLEQELLNQQYAAAQPKSRHYELVPEEETAPEMKPRKSVADFLP